MDSAIFYGENLAFDGRKRKVYIISMDRVEELLQL